MSSRLLLKKWHFIIKSYCECFRKLDAPYWYNERATLSTFAGAIWKAGGLALEEYQAKKKHGLGRVDLWFRWRNKDYIGEVKQHWVRLDKKGIEDTLIDDIDKKVKNAMSDVAASTEEAYPLGFVFIVPSISVANKSSKNNLLLSFLKRLQELDFCMSAWSFPSVARELEWENNLYPGVALIVKSSLSKGKK